MIHNITIIFLPGAFHFQGVRVVVFNATFNNIMAVSFIGGRNRIARRKPPTCHN
jgi:hypothetical protein